MSNIAQAIETIQDMLDVLETAGSCYVYKHNGGADRLRNVLECLRAQQELANDTNVPTNPPLTLDELRQMDGEPVWIRVAGGVWGLVDGFDSVVRLVRGGTIDLSRIAEISYRHKAQGTTITCTATGQPCIMCQMGPCESRKEVASELYVYHNPMQ